MDEGFVAIWIVMIIFGAIAAIIVGPSWLKSREKRDIQQTVRHAIDKGQQLPPELIDAMTREVQGKLPSRSRDLRKGIIWTATGIGIGLFSVVSSLGEAGWGSENFDNGLLGIACVPLTIGLAFIALSFFNKNKD
ncbi:MAG: hypothetical protein KJ676_11855 [Alphaproteobacteria bacterium]|nr:hypothetical protein [Alphaproteobacteria bacterium]MBU1525965.1 hypothetical protein [Alphaproteobacteria bacterium]MBU2116749.1 hypothetical protein [Alphaproteobacteria bacterium]MBU2350373.1 hypothetical protein [Alphaproteobacteria bacterium]MBU2381607.1 hypothetical protein [Alphaproteobacteria bacterium]